MNEIKTLAEEIQALSESTESFIDKPNKAKSKRLRSGLNDLKKKVTEYKKLLIELDTAGY